MAGDTNNLNFMDAYNQIVQAINDIQIGLETGEPSQNLAALLEIVGENIEAFRVTFETRSTAETTAFNTQFDVVNSQLQAIVSKMSTGGGGCCCGGGNYTVQPKSTIGYSGGEVPTNPTLYPVWTIPDGAPTYIGGIGSTAFNLRSCKVANMTMDVYENIIATWRDNGVDTLALPLAQIALGYYIGELYSVIPVLDGLLGLLVAFATEVALTMTEVNTDFTELHTELVLNRDDLVCCLYKYGDAYTAKTEFKQILADAGVVEGNLRVMDVLLCPDLLNLLWFKRDMYTELQIENYSGPQDCSGCDVDCYPVMIISPSWEGVIDDNTPPILQGTSGSTGGEHWFRPRFNSSDTGAICGNTVTINSITPVGFTAASPAGYRFFNDVGTAIYSSNTPPASPVSGVHWVAMKSSTSFTVSINYTEDI